jgi:hypothetical protein
MIPSIKKTSNVKLAKGVPNGCECCGIFFVSFKGCPYVTSNTKYVTISRNHQDLTLVKLQQPGSTFEN